MPGTVRLLYLLSILLAGCGPANSIRLARGSFLHIAHKHTISVCEDSSCQEQSVYSLGSGFIIGTLRDKTVGLTAGHVCVGKPGSRSEISVTALDGKSVQTEDVLVYTNIDVCILQLPASDSPAVRVAKRPPRVGEKVFSLSAPLGTFAPNMVPIFEGRYLGKVNSPLGIPLDAYSIPGTSGSSGGMIINDRGQVVGMTIMARVGFETFTLAVPHEILKSLIDKLSEHD